MLDFMILPGQYVGIAADIRVDTRGFNFLQ